MATQEKTWNVANRLHSMKDSDKPEVNHIIAGADEIYDDTKGAKQSDINAQTDAALADRYTKAETYSKEQLDSLITTPDANYVTVATFADLPQTGEANTIYRVSSYDGTQVDASKYALYAWNGATYQLLAVRSAVGEVFDVSEYNSGATYETLAAALAAVPASVQKGGMSIKFILRTNTGTEEEPVYHDEYVQYFDNTYVCYMLKSQSWTTDVLYWEKVNSETDVRLINEQINKINITSDAAGVTPYTFQSGTSYYIINNDNTYVTISHRNTPDGTSEDSLTLSPNQSAIYTVTSNGLYLRYGRACNLSIYKIGGLYDLASAGYKYIGIATQSSSPSINTAAKVFYIASNSGTYTNYGGLVISSNGLFALKYDGSWSYETLLAFDDKLSVQSNNAIENKVVSSALGNVELHPENTEQIIDVGSVSIGDVIPSPRTTSSYLGYYIMPASVGDYIVVTCNNLSGVRYWAWLDSQNKVLDRPDANVSEVNVKHVAPQNTAYLLAQFKDSSTKIKFTPKDSIEDKIEFNKKSINDVKTDIRKELEGTILSAGQWIDFDFKKDEIYQVTILNTDDYGRAITFSTANVKDVSQIIDRIAVNLGTGETSEPFTITQNAKYLRVGGYSYGGEFVLTSLSTIEGRIKSLENDEGEKIHREFPFAPDYVLSRVPQLTGGDKYVQTSDVDDLYDLYDGLLARYPDYIEKIDMSDADQFISVERPAALEGLPIYMYHFKPIRFNDLNGHGDDANRFPIYINAGTHPGEKFNLFTTYYLMEMICDNWKNDLNAEQLRCLTDIYVVPCNSPYGFEVSGRVNENGVNLNRNYPTEDWVVSGYGTNDYSGPTAGSEYETQLTMYYVNLIKPKVFIDVHTPNMDEPLRDKGTTIVNGAYGKDIGTVVCITTNTILVKENSDYPEIEDWPLYTLKDYGAMGSVGKWAYENGGCMSVCLEGSENNKWHNGVWDSEYNENRTNKLMRENIQFFFNYLLRATNAMCKMYYTVKDGERV